MCRSQAVPIQDLVILFPIFLFLFTSILFGVIGGHKAQPRSSSAKVFNNRTSSSDISSSLQDEEDSDAIDKYILLGKISYILISVIFVIAFASLALTKYLN